MSDPIINGSNEPQFNREEIRFGGLSGGEWSQRIQGPPDKLKALIGQLIQAGASGVYICDQSPIATIEFSIGTIEAITGNAANEAPQVSYECSTNEVEKDVLESDITVVNNLSTSQKKLLRKRIDGTELNSTEEATLTGDAANLYQDILDGLRSVRVPVPTLRISKVVSNLYPVKASNTNAGKIHTTAQVSTAESIPVSILFELESKTTTKARRAYGWRKNYPDVTITGGNRFSISQQYEYGLWSTTIYQFV